MATQAPSSASAAEQSDTYTADLKRLTILMRLVEGAWALAEFEDGGIRRNVIAQLRSDLAPLLVLEISLAGINPDPLAILQKLPATFGQPAPIVCFVDVGSAFPDLCGYLDLQRESLALLPYRLILWVTPYDRDYLAEHSPNFFSRISGIFRFPGSMFTSMSAQNSEQRALRSPETTLSARQRLRPVIAVHNEVDRERQIEHLRRRIQELERLLPPDPQAIGDSWFDLGGLYDQATPSRWEESEAAYCAAVRYYEQANNTTAKAAALKEAGGSAYAAYATKAALLHFKRALLLYQLLEDRLGEANVLKAIGDVQQFQDKQDAARESYDAALELYRAVGDRLGEANVLKALGDVQQFQDERDAARESYEAALRLFRAVGDRLGEANVLKALGDLQQFRKQLDAARESYDAALELYRAVGDRLGEANVLLALGDLQQFRKQLDAALESYDAALRLFRTVGSKLGEANVLKALGDLQRFRAEWDAARESYEAALRLFRAVGDRLGEANVLLALGDLQQFRKQLDAALESYDAALRLFRAVGDRLGEANVLAAQSRLLIDQDFARSQALQQQAVELYHAVGSIYGAAAGYYNYGLALINRERKAAALPYLQQARALFAAHGLDADVHDTDDLIARAEAAEQPAPGGEQHS